MRSTTAMRLGAAITASALALSLGTGPASAGESTKPLSTTSAVPENRPGARLATGADIAGASASRSADATAAATAVNGNITQLKAYSAELNNAVENYIDVDVWLDDPSAAVDGISLYVSVDGTKTRALDLWYDPELDVTFVIVPGTVGLGRALFYGAMIHYTDESGLAPTWDSTDSNAFYVRRSVGFEAQTDYNASGNTKEFYVSGMTIFSPSLGDFRALSKIKLQYKTSSGWETKKTIYLDSNGDGYYKFTSSTRRYYRIISGRTSTFVGFNSGATPKI